MPFEVLSVMYSKYDVTVTVLCDRLTADGLCESVPLVLRCCCFDVSCWLCIASVLQKQRTLKDISSH